MVNLDSVLRFRLRHEETDLHTPVVSFFSTVSSGLCVLLLLTYIHLVRSLPSSSVPQFNFLLRRRRFPRVTKFQCQPIPDSFVERQSDDTLRWSNVPFLPFSLRNCTSSLTSVLEGLQPTSIFPLPPPQDLPLSSISHKKIYPSIPSKPKIKTEHSYSIRTYFPNF